jgi:hypothetical protein
MWEREREREGRGGRGGGEGGMMRSVRVRATAFKGTGKRADIQGWNR